MNNFLSLDIDFLEYTITENPDVVCVEVTPPVHNMKKGMRKNNQSLTKKACKRRLEECNDEVVEPKLTGKDVSLLVSVNYMLVFLSIN